MTVPSGVSKPASRLPSGSACTIEPICDSAAGARETATAQIDPTETPRTSSAEFLELIRHLICATE